MPATVIPITGRRQGTFVVFEAGGNAIGVLLVDPSSDRGWVRFRADFESFEDPEVFEHLQEHIGQLLSEGGAEALLASLEDSLSNAIRIGERQAVEVDAFTRVLDRLYSEHVQAVAVRPFETHLPLFSLRAAAGALGEEMESAAEDWVRAPEG